MAAGLFLLAPNSRSFAGASEAIQKGQAFLVNLLDPDLGLLPEYRGSSVYWLFHDNYLAAKVLAQEDSGGRITDYDKSGKKIGLANVETTCLCILGLETLTGLRR